MAEPKDMILPLLKEIRKEQRQMAEALAAGFAKADKRFDKLEGRFDNLRQAVAGESVLGRYAAAEVEERLEKLEKRLAVLEGRI